MQFIDTHCHLDLLANYNQTVLNAHKNGVSDLICPSLGANFDKVWQICKSSQHIYMALGIYPSPSKIPAYQKLPKDLLDKMHIYLENLEYRKQIVAIGECGLDFTRVSSETEKQVQIELFISQIMLANKYRLPMILHTRGTGEIVLDLVLKYKLKKAVFHSFSGSKKLAKKIIDAGYYLGVGGLMTVETGLQKILKEVDLKYLVLETDAPYLIPKPFKGKVAYNEPRYIPDIAKILADVKQLSLAEIAERTTLNAQQLFSKLIV